MRGRVGGRMDEHRRWRADAAQLRRRPEGGQNEAKMGFRILSEFSEFCMFRSGPKNKTIANPYIISWRDPKIRQKIRTKFGQKFGIQSVGQGGHPGAQPSLRPPAWRPDRSSRRPLTRPSAQPLLRPPLPILARPSPSSPRPNLPRPNLRQCACLATPRLEQGRRTRSQLVCGQ